MEAQLFSLDDIRAKQRTATRMERILYAQTALDGLALQRSVTSFWAEYATAMTSFHARLLSSVFSPWSKPQTSADKRPKWL